MDTAGLVRAAARGDQDAWDALVDRYNGLLWSIARGYGLPSAEAADVVQTAWLRLVERLDTIREPEHVGSWLATTARRECFRSARAASRSVPTDDERFLERGQAGASPAAQIIASERDTILWQSLDRLSDRCRRLLRILMADPPPRYAEVSAALDMPVGSIGPTRARCLQELRRVVEDAGVSVDAGDEL